MPCGSHLVEIKKSFVLKIRCMRFESAHMSAENIKLALGEVIKIIKKKFW